MWVFFLSDVIVHRLLSAALGIAKLPPVFQDGPQLTSVADSKPINKMLCPMSFI